MTDKLNDTTLSFKAGDRVRFIGEFLYEDITESFKLLPGATGTVTEVELLFTMVTWDDNEHTVGCVDRTGWPMLPRELEHIND